MDFDMADSSGGARQAWPRRTDDRQQWMVKGGPLGIGDEKRHGDRPNPSMMKGVDDISTTFYRRRRDQRAALTAAWGHRL
jgi:hypothetical protein